jgi:hypothetical protein
VDSKIRVRLRAFAEGLSGPLGSVPLDRAIRVDLRLFRDLRESGATWPQIANALAAAGARRPDGSLISADHVRSAVSRQLKRNPLPTEIQQEHATPKNRQRFPRASQVPHKPVGISSRHRVEGTKPIIRPEHSDQPGKDSVTEAAAPSSGRSNQSILDKLARTRRLRES